MPGYLTEKPDDSRIRAVQIYLAHDGHALCVRREKTGDSWQRAHQPFGGGVEEGQSPADCRDSELEEEFGPSIVCLLREHPELVADTAYFDNGKMVIQQVFVRLPDDAPLPEFRPVDPEGPLAVLSGEDVGNMVPLEKEWKSAGVPDGILAAFPDAIEGFRRVLTL